MMWGRKILIMERCQSRRGSAKEARKDFESVIWPPSNQASSWKGVSTNHCIHATHEATGPALRSTSFAACLMWMMLFVPSPTSA